MFLRGQSPPRVDEQEGNKAAPGLVGMVKDAIVHHVPERTEHLDTFEQLVRHGYENQVSAVVAKFLRRGKVE